jgi:hypothetical protein
MMKKNVESMELITNNIMGFLGKFSMFETIFFPSNFLPLSEPKPKLCKFDFIAQVIVNIN